MTLFTGTAPTFAAGDNSTVVANLNILRDGLKATSEARTAYTPTWSGTLGNGTLIGKWNRENKRVWYSIFLTWGSTTSHAAATQTFLLPTAAHADYTANMNLGSGTATDVSVPTFQTFGAAWLSSTSVFIHTPNAGAATNLIPWTWAVGDKLSITGIYETA